MERRSDAKTRKKSKQQLDDLEERRGYYKLKQEALDCPQWRGYSPVVRETGMNISFTEKVSERV
jgi:hypothetical protein